MWTRIGDIERMFGAMDLLRSRMNRAFMDYDRYGEPGYGRGVSDGMPPTSLFDCGDHLEFMAEVPGIAKEDLKVKIQGNYLELSGNRKASVPEGYKAHRVEKAATSFTRSFTLPYDVDAEKTEATLQNGILLLKFPKSEAAKPRQITIN